MAMEVLAEMGLFSNLLKCSGISSIIKAWQALLFFFLQEFLTYGK
jgi:hypothetical protein